MWVWHAISITVVAGIVEKIHPVWSPVPRAQQSDTSHHFYWYFPPCFAEELHRRLVIGVLAYCICAEPCRWFPALEGAELDGLSPFSLMCLQFQGTNNYASPGKPSPSSSQKPGNKIPAWQSGQSCDLQGSRHVTPNHPSSLCSWKCQSLSIEKYKNSLLLWTITMDDICCYRQEINTEVYIKKCSTEDNT